jgi:hypothetical protein
VSSIAQLWKQNATVEASSQHNDPFLGSTSVLSIILLHSHATLKYAVSQACSFVGSEILTALLKTRSFWVVTLCHGVSWYRPFEERSLRVIRNHSPNNKVSYPRRSGSSCYVCQCTFHTQLVKDLVCVNLVQSGTQLCVSLVHFFPQHLGPTAKSQMAHRMPTSSTDGINRSSTKDEVLWHNI